MTNQQDSHENSAEATPSHLERWYRDRLVERVEHFALEFEEIAAQIRSSIVELNSVGEPTGPRSYVAVTTALSAAVHDRVTRMQLDRLALGAVEADLDRARRLAGGGQ